MNDFPCFSDEQYVDFYCLIVCASTMCVYSGVGLGWGEVFGFRMKMSQETVIRG